MSTVITKQYEKVVRTHLMVKSGERLRIWRKAKGVWKYRKPDPVKELRTLRNGWR